MEPQDDPEARIRELERPLADVAGRSELGSAQPTGYSPTQPLPPPVPPSDNYPVAQWNTTRGFRWGWMVFATLAVGVVALAAGIIVYTTHQSSRDDSSVGFPTTSPRSTLSRSPAPSTRAPGTGTQAPSITPSIPPPGGTLSVAGSNKNETIACNDSVVSVSGVSNTVVLTGHCASVTVSGVQNLVTVDTTDAISASGMQNRVTFHSGSPRVDKSGFSNVVEQG